MFFTKASLLIFVTGIFGVSSVIYGDEATDLKKIIAVQQAQIQEMRSNIEQMEIKWDEKISSVIEQTNRRFDQLRIRIDHTPVNYELKYITMTEENGGHSHSIAHCNQENALISYLRLYRNPNPTYFDRIACATVDITRGTPIDTP